MARTDIPVQTLAAYGGEVEDISYTAADQTNDMSFTHPGGPCFILVKNDHDAPLDVVIKAVASPRTLNMAEDLTLSTTNAESSVISIPAVGYDQGSAVVNVDIADEGDGDDLLIAVFSLLPSP